jgi:hypothetical protein
METGLTTRNEVGLISPLDIENMKSQALILVKSGLLPRSVDTAEKAIVIMMKGRELGLAPIHALSHIHVINGKPCMSAELMLAMIRKNCKGAIINIIERTNERCVIEASRPAEKTAAFVFTMDDARMAGLTGNPTWTKYPRAMLHARCVSEMARAMFPDAIAGASYTPEEMGALVNEDGEVIDIPADSKAGDKSVAEELTKKLADLPAPKILSTPQHYKTYDPAEHWTTVSVALKSKNVDPNLWKLISESMVGKPYNQASLEEAIRQAQRAAH